MDILKNTKIYLSSFFIILFVSSTLLGAPPEDKKNTSVYSHNCSLRFQKFMRFIGHKLEKFQMDYMPKAESVFYPFGGPDIIHPLILFPDAKTYVLVGMEPVGKALSDANKNDAQENIRSLLGRGYFVTSAMAKMFKEKSGVRSAIALQILLMGGKITEDTLIDPHTASINFEWKGESRVVLYSKQNLAENLEGLFDLLKKHNVSHACLLKSSSYSLHKKLFSNLKDKIVNHFPLIVQDDTGIPFKDLKDNFDVEFFGRYRAPYGVEFRGFEQPDLRKIFASTKNIPSLNFCFGYGCARVEANMMIAKRKDLENQKKSLSSHTPKETQ